MSKIWFKRKLYGWGWTPVTWQGWAVILVWLGFIFFLIRYFDANSHYASGMLRPFLVSLILSVFVLLYVCYKKGEKPRWQWGKRRED